MLIRAPGRPLADVIAELARTLDLAEPTRFLRHIGDDDAFHRGPQPGGVMFVVPGLWASMPAPLLAGLRVRRACSVTGRCPACGECLALATGTVAHDNGCVVLDAHLLPLALEWLHRVGRHARGRRLREIPGSGDPDRVA